MLVAATLFHAGAGNKRLQAADDELTGHKALYKDAHKQQRTLQKQSWMDRWAAMQWWH